MLYLQLFWAFLCVGLFSFGGAYSAIPLIRDAVLSRGWLTEEELSYMIAVSESTPGPLMVNLATYVGSDRGGLAGAAVATFAVILPPFVVILLVMVVFSALLKNAWFNAALDAMKPCISGVILATGASMIAGNLLPAAGSAPDLLTLCVTGLLALVLFLPEAVWKKKVSPILFIVVSAVVGVAAWGFFS